MEEPMESINQKSIRNQAKQAAFGYLVIFFCGIFANFYVLENIFGQQHSAGLSAVFKANLVIFQWGNLAFFITMIIDVAIGWQLFQILKGANKELASFSALLRIVYATILGIALYHLSQMMWLVSDETMQGTGEVDWQLLMHKVAFNKVWVMGLVIFGIHLMLTGWIIIKSSDFSSLIGYGLLLAGSGYIADGGAQLILYNYEAWSMLFNTWVLVGGVVGEMAFMIYLFYLGYRKVA